ncbi:hypothetical protein BV898_12506 [Hypsibius exemplaris]|uniref:Uncharacterized protein n=1 Tax=Hypsibius exemplaris TaxID=2072580 RepID=A0A1W0WDL9_HYPEX|nr:hypothetical protein BV898_12506 [Hypsibius exemplaris]
MHVADGSWYGLWVDSDGALLRRIRPSRSRISCWKRRLLPGAARCVEHRLADGGRRHLEQVFPPNGEIFDFRIKFLTPRLRPP